MIIPYIMENKCNVPNHQPAMVWIITQMIFWSVDVRGEYYYYYYDDMIISRVDGWC